MCSIRTLKANDLFSVYRTKFHSNLHSLPFAYNFRNAVDKFKSNIQLPVVRVPTSEQKQNKLWWWL